MIMAYKPSAELLRQATRVTVLKVRCGREFCRPAVEISVGDLGAFQVGFWVVQLSTVHRFHVSKLVRFLFGAGIGWMTWMAPILQPKPDNNNHRQFKSQRFLLHLQQPSQIQQTLNPSNICHENIHKRRRLDPSTTRQ